MRLNKTHTPIVFQEVILTQKETNCMGVMPIQVEIKNKEFCLYKEGEILCII
jgi:hypothetical protein